MSYWDRVLAGRVSRRRALSASGATALATALLAACGGGKKAAPGDSSGLLTAPEDTSAKAVSGGIFQTSQDIDLGTADPFKAAGLTPLMRLGDYYDFLVKFDRATLGRAGPVAPQAAESWEFSPDGLTLTFKIRPNHRFDPRPPTNSRPMTATDVKFSWDRFLAFSGFGNDLNPKNAGAVISSLNATDDRTVVVKLNFPYLSALDLFAHTRYLAIMPTEAEDKFDARQETRGSGPFYLEKWEPSVRVVEKRNPNWYEKGIPYLDGVVETIIPNASAALAQFEAGNIWNGAGYRPEDVLRVKRDHPAMVLSQTYPTLGGGSAFTTSRQPGSIFNDVRARQALSMLVDRDLYLQVIEGTELFTSAGLPVKASWNSHIPAQNSEWLDPKKNELGEGSKYFHYDVAEAKKLLAAAGYDGSAALSYHQGDVSHDPKIMDVLVGMWRQGINMEAKPLAYQTTWRDVCQRSSGLDYNGVCYNTGSGINAEQHISRWYAPGGDYKARLGDFPALSPLAQKIRVELDRERQIEMIKQFQREAAVAMPLVMSIGAVTGFDLHWPWLENFGLWTANESSPHVRAYYWYNKSKNPKAS